MFNLPPLRSIERIDVKIIPTVLKSWQIGQILESRAKTSSNAAGELQIQVGQNLLNATTKNPIQAGEELTLQVTKLGDTPLLKILNSPIKTDPITIHLRQAVPQNNSIQKLLNLANHVTQLIPDIEPPISTNTPLKASKNLELINFSKQLNALIQIPLKSNEVSAKNIQTFVKQSGLDFENQLIAKETIPTKNLKLDLIQLKQPVNQLLNSTNYTAIAKDPQLVKALISNNQLPTLASYLLYGVPPADKSIIISFLTNPIAFNDNTLSEMQTSIFQAIHKLTPSQNLQLKQWIQFLPVLAEMRQLIEQSINTINNHQLQALQADADSAFMVLFNLLVAKNPEWVDLFNIKISKEEKEGEDDHWQVTIQLEMPDLGLIQAKLVLIKKQLHAGVTSQLEITHQLIQEHLGILKSALIQSGFDVATISCKQETIKPFTSNQLRHGPLLDDKA